MTKHHGGRGRMSPNKHLTVTVSLSPADKALLDSWVTPELSRSEVVSRLIQAHATRPTAAKFADVPLFALRSPAPPADPTTPPPGQRLRAGPTNPTTSTHAQILNELSQGGVLAFDEGEWIMTENSGPQRKVGPNVIRDMLRAGELQEAD